MNIRLDFINNIHPSRIELMTKIRKAYQEIDKMIVEFNNQDSVGFIKKPENDGAQARAIALARTHNEISLQYAIKSLCLDGEIDGGESK